MGKEQELLETAAAAIDEIAGVLEGLRTTYPDSSLVEECAKVQQQLTWYLNDAREKLNRRELNDEDAAALALIINRGMDKMIRIVETDEKSSEC